MGKHYGVPVEIVPLNQAIETVEKPGLSGLSDLRSIAHARAAELAEQKEILRQAEQLKTMGKTMEKIVEIS